MYRKHCGSLLLSSSSKAILSSFSHAIVTIRNAGHCGSSAVCLRSMAGPLLWQGIVGRVLYVLEAWRALCCCRALWLSAVQCMPRKHGRPFVVAGHCGSSAVCLGSMAGPLLLQGIVVECCTMYASEAWQALCCCRALWVQCHMSRKHGRPSAFCRALWVQCCMSQKHGGLSTVAGHCRSSAVRLRSMLGPLLLSPLSKMVLSIVSTVECRIRGMSNLRLAVQ